MREYKLTFWAYSKRYYTAGKQFGETYVMFASRLFTMLSYYIASKNVKTIDDLKSLLIADHIKDMISPDCFQQILAVKNTEKKGWLTHNKLAEVIDKYLASHGFEDKPQTCVNPAYVYTPQSKPVYNQKQVSTKHKSRINQNADAFTAITNYISLKTVHIMITKRKMMDMSKRNNSQIAHRKSQLKYIQQ